MSIIDNISHCGVYCNKMRFTKPFGVTGKQLVVVKYKRNHLVYYGIEFELFEIILHREILKLVVPDNFWLLADSSGNTISHC